MYGDSRRGLRVISSKGELRHEHAQEEDVRIVPDPTYTQLQWSDQHSHHGLSKNFVLQQTHTDHPPATPTAVMPPSLCPSHLCYHDTIPHASSQLDEWTGARTLMALPCRQRSCGSGRRFTRGDADALEVGEHKAGALVGGRHAGKQDRHYNAPCKG